MTTDLVILNEFYQLGIDKSRSIIISLINEQK